MDIKITDGKLLEKYIDTHYLYTQFGYYEFFNNITVPEVEAIVMDTIEDIFPEPFSIRKHTCKYDNRFNFEVNIETKNIYCLVEWNYMKECYKFRKGDNAFTYFESYDSLIRHIIREFKNVNTDTDKLITDCTHLIKAIETSSKVDISLDYLINRIKDPQEIEDMLYGDLPF
ncbi:hypothetical protein [Radiobacillus sp. PE A8.2]|uniref:hypothetical protein n=1 Tax=Radiobacillus sp. PE A8.2 TaxID=3380349 RepID=UPI0038905452